MEDEATNLDTISTFGAFLKCGVLDLQEASKDLLILRLLYDSHGVTLNSMIPIKSQ